MRGSKKLKLTTRGRYAVMAMVELAQRGEKNPIPLTEIANAGSISLSYLEQLFAGLRNNGLVKSYRGPGGGYILAKPATEIMIADILDSAEDCVSVRRAAKKGDSKEINCAQTRVLWGHIGEILYHSLKHISLDDVMQDRLGEHPAMDRLFEALA